MLAFAHKLGSRRARCQTRGKARAAAASRRRRAPRRNSRVIVTLRARLGAGLFCAIKSSGPSPNPPSRTGILGAGRAIGASSPARAQLRTDGCAPSRARRLPKPESTGSSSHLGRGCGRSGRRLLRASLTYRRVRSLGARRLLRLGTPRIPICFARPVDPGLRSSRPASQSASSDRWIRAWRRRSARVIR